MLLLTTKGRVSGRSHTVPLLYLRDNDNLVVIASYGGRDRAPSWYLNLLAHPTVEVQVRADRFNVTARVADAEERARWWPRVVDAYSDYEIYQSRTSREIPIVFLEPVQSASLDSPRIQ
jgi:F420H(2)-dependent quinone reductase